MFLPWSILERVLKISRAVLRRGGAAGFVAPRLQISLEYAPSSRLAIRPAALAIPFPVYFQNTLLTIPLNSDGRKRTATGHREPATIVCLTARILHEFDKIVKFFLCFFLCAS